MPWNGVGAFFRNYSWVADALAGIGISPTRIDADTDDIVNTGLTNCLTRDGQGFPNINLNMNGFRHTGVGNGVASTDYVALGQLQSYGWVAATGTGDNMVANYNPPITQLTDGLLLQTRVPTTNVTFSPAFNPNGLGSAQITFPGSTLNPGDLIAGDEIMLRWNAAFGVWQLMNRQFHFIGEVIPWASPNIPGAYLNCTGQNVSQTEYPALYALLGTTYGNPGAGLFTMPDFRGNLIYGLDQGTNRISTYFGQTQGTQAGAQNQSYGIAQGNLPGVNFSCAGFSLTSDPGHNHSKNDPQHYHGISDQVHAHGIGDPGNIHSLGQGSLESGQNLTYEGTPGVTSQGGQNTSTNGTNIYYGGSGCNLSGQYHPADLSNNGSGTNDYINSGYFPSGGSNTGYTTETCMPGQCVYWIMRAA